MAILMTGDAPEVPAVLAIFETALGKISTDFSGMMGAALPVGLSIMGTILVIGLGITFFRHIVKA